jgi:hypothetical protein
MTKDEACLILIRKGAHLSAYDLNRMIGISETDAQAMIDREHRKVIEGYEIGNNILWCDCTVCAPTKGGRQGIVSLNEIIRQVHSAKGGERQ